MFLILRKQRELITKYYALTIRLNHEHIDALVSKESIEQAVHRYKYSATLALRKFGLQGKIWSKGFDKRFCFTGKELETRIRYVQGHHNG